MADRPEYLSKFTGEEIDSGIDLAQTALQPSNVVQDSGDSTTNIMSQNAVTNLFDSISGGLGYLINTQVGADTPQVGEITTNQISWFNRTPVVDDYYLELSYSSAGNFISIWKVNSISGDNAVCQCQSFINAKNGENGLSIYVLSTDLPTNSGSTTTEENTNILNYDSNRVINVGDILIGHNGYLSQVESVNPTNFNTVSLGIAINGVDALQYDRYISLPAEPTDNMAVNLFANRFNRTPVYGDKCYFIYENSNTNELYFCIGTEQGSDDNIQFALSNFVKINGTNGVSIYTTSENLNPNSNSSQLSMLTSTLTPTFDPTNYNGALVISLNENSLGYIGTISQYIEDPGAVVLDIGELNSRTTFTGTKIFTTDNELNQTTQVIPNNSTPKANINDYFISTNANSKGRMAKVTSLTTTNQCQVNYVMDLMGSNSENGVDSLVCNQMIMYPAPPTTENNIIIPISNFNRTPTIGDACILLFQVNTNDTYISMATCQSVDTLGTNTALFKCSDPIQKLNGSNGNNGTDGYPIYYINVNLSTNIGSEITTQKSNITPTTPEITQGNLILGANGYIGQVSRIMGETVYIATIINLNGESGANGNAGKGWYTTNEIISNTTTNITPSSITPTLTSTDDYIDNLVVSSVSGEYARITGYSSAISLFTVEYIGDLKGVDGTNGTNGADGADGNSIRYTTSNLTTSSSQSINRTTLSPTPESGENVTNNLVVSSNGILAQITGALGDVINISYKASLKGTNGDDGTNGKGIYSLNSSISQSIGTSNVLVDATLVTPQLPYSSDAENNFLLSTNGKLLKIDSYVNGPGGTIIDGYYCTVILALNGAQGVDGYSIRYTTQNLSTDTNIAVSVLESSITPSSEPNIKINDLIIGANGYLGRITGLGGGVQTSYSVSTLYKLMGSNGSDGTKWYTTTTEITENGQTNVNENTIAQTVSSDLQGGNFVLGLNGNYGEISMENGVSPNRIFVVTYRGTLKGVNGANGENGSNGKGWYVTSSEITSDTQYLPIGSITPQPAPTGDDAVNNYILSSANGGYARIMAQQVNMYTIEYIGSLKGATTDETPLICYYVSTSATGDETIENTYFNRTPIVNDKFNILATDTNNNLYLKVCTVTSVNETTTTSSSDSITKYNVLNMQEILSHINSCYFANVSTTNEINTPMLIPLSSLRPPTVTNVSDIIGNVIIGQNFVGTVQGEISGQANVLVLAKNESANLTLKTQTTTNSQLKNQLIELFNGTTNTFKYVTADFSTNNLTLDAKTITISESGTTFSNSSPTINNIINFTELYIDSANAYLSNPKIPAQDIYYWDNGTIKKDNINLSSTPNQLIYSSATNGTNTISEDVVFTIYYV